MDPFMENLIDESLDDFEQYIINNTNSILVLLKSKNISYEPGLSDIKPIKLQGNPSQIQNQAYIDIF